MNHSSPSDNVLGLTALRGGAGLVELPVGGWITVRGDDRVRWLNGMVTNSVQELKPGEGAYSFLLSAQGRIQGDCTVWAEEKQLLLETDAAQAAGIVTLLDRFIIMDDVELEDVSAMSHGLLLAGPETLTVLRAAGASALPDAPMRRVVVDIAGETVALLHAWSPLVPRFEVWSPEAASLGQVRDALMAAGGVGCSLEDLEMLRVLEGTPKYGVDIRERDLPQETAQTRALHFNKGCYLGQEIVERIRSRGNVHRTLAGFTLEGNVPAPGAALMAEGKQVGELTSVAAEVIDGERTAIGVVRREALERGLALTYGNDADATGEARQRSLPAGQ